MGDNTGYNCPHCGRGLEWVSSTRDIDGDDKDVYDCPPCKKDYYTLNDGELRER